MNAIVNDRKLNENEIKNEWEKFFGTRSAVTHSGHGAQLPASLSAESGSYLSVDLSQHRRSYFIREITRWGQKSDPVPRPPRPRRPRRFAEGRFEAATPLASSGESSGWEDLISGLISHSRTQTPCLCDTPNPTKFAGDSITSTCQHAVSSGGSWDDRMPRDTRIARRKRRVAHALRSAARAHRHLQKILENMGERGNIFKMMFPRRAG